MYSNVVFVLLFLDNVVYVYLNDIGDILFVVDVMIIDVVDVT